MHPMITATVIILILSTAGLGLVVWDLRRRSLDRWLVPYILGAAKRRAPRSREEVHLLLCIADHYEPKNGNVARAYSGTGGPLGP